MKECRSLWGATQPSRKPLEVEDQLPVGWDGEGQFAVINCHIFRAQGQGGEREGHAALPLQGGSEAKGETGHPR